MTSRPIRNKRRRRGAATVELAVVTPLLLTMLFGIIEYGWISAVRQTLTQAAREGVRTAALPGTTSDEIMEQVADVMTPIGVSSYDVDITRGTIEDPTEVVRVTVAYGDVTLVGAFFGSTDFNLSSECSARREGMD